MTSNNSQQRIICLSSLPIGALAHAASYLAVPSRALLAVALDSREEGGSNSAIVGKEVDTLDFGDIEKDLAAKVSDENIRDVLLCIDSQNNLKKLRLTNCINITGAGLEPLRGSTVIENIDLSLGGNHESLPQLDPEPPISCDEVLPILDSIIETGENSALKFLVPPKVWRKEIDEESDFHAFLIRYNDFLSRRSTNCTKCNCNLPTGRYDDVSLVEFHLPYYGTQYHTCYWCWRHFCEDCRDEDGRYCIASCDKCEMSYCSHCQLVEYCEWCYQTYCVECVKFKECSSCENKACSDCTFNYDFGHFHCEGDCGADSIWCGECQFENSYSCESCHVKYCSPCSESNANGARFCTQASCETSCLCGQCRVVKCEEGSDCKGCLEHAFVSLLATRKTSKEENDELRDQIKEVTDENNELKRKWEGLDGGDGE